MKKFRSLISLICVIAVILTPSVIFSRGRTDGAESAAAFSRENILIGIGDGSSLIALMLADIRAGRMYLLLGEGMSLARERYARLSERGADAMPALTDEVSERLGEELRYLYISAKGFSYVCESLGEVSHPDGKDVYSHLINAHRKGDTEAISSTIASFFSSVKKNVSPVTALSFIRRLYKSIKTDIALSSALGYVNSARDMDMKRLYPRNI